MTDVSPRIGRPRRIGPNGEKWCPQCEAFLDRSMFGKHRTQPDGLYGLCKKCKRATAAAWAAANDPDGAKRKAYSKAYRLRNLEKRRAADREAKRRQKGRDPERVRARRKAWEARNRDYLRKSWHLKSHVRRARMADVLTVPFTDDALRARLAFYGFRCWICGADYEAIDHVKPIAKGGAHMLANLRPICTPCNSRKRDCWPYPQ